jgi:hypothetical protein
LGIVEDPSLKYSANDEDIALTLLELCALRDHVDFLQNAVEPIRDEYNQLVASRGTGNVKLADKVKHGSRRRGRCRTDAIIAGRKQTKSTRKWMNDDAKLIDKASKNIKRRKLMKDDTGTTNK